MSSLQTRVEALKSYIECREESRVHLETSFVALKEEIVKLKSQEHLKTVKKEKEEPKTKEEKVEEPTRNTDLGKINSSPRPELMASQVLAGLSFLSEPMLKKVRHEEEKSQTEVTNDGEEKLATESNMSSLRRKRRGKLPDHSTSLLKKWIFDHWWHPYPTG